MKSSEDNGYSYLRTLLLLLGFALCPFHDGVMRCFYIHPLKNLLFLFHASTFLACRVVSPKLHYDMHPESPSMLTRVLLYHLYHLS